MKKQLDKNLIKYAKGCGLKIKDLRNPRVCALVKRSFEYGVHMLAVVLTDFCKHVKGFETGGRIEHE